MDSKQNIVEGNTDKNVSFDNDIANYWDILGENVKRFYEVACLARVNIVIEDCPPEVKQDYEPYFLPACIRGRMIVHNFDAVDVGHKPVKYYHHRPTFDTLVSRIRRNGKSLNEIIERLKDAKKCLQVVPHKADKILPLIEKKQAGYNLIKKAFDRMSFSYHEFVVTMKMTNAIRALCGSNTFKANHIAEAIQYVYEGKKVKL